MCVGPIERTNDRGHRSCTASGGAPPPWSSTRCRASSAARSDFEIKYDGYRVLAEIDAGRVRPQTCNGADATAWFPEIMMSLAGTPGHQLLDGEVCVVDELGRSDFERLKRRAQMRRYKPGADLVAYCAFDILVADGCSVMDEQLVRRKERLADVFAQRPDQLLVVSAVEGEGEWLFQQALGLKLEGIVAKRLDSVYRPGTKCSNCAQY